MVLDLESEARRDLVLAPLDAAVHELLDLSAVHADDVVVVLALVQLEDRRAALEMMALDEFCGLELRQHAIHGREADVFALVHQRAVDVFGRQVTTVVAGEDLEDLHARQRDLESRLAQVAGLHLWLPPRAAAIPL